MELDLWEFKPKISLTHLVQHRYKVFSLGLSMAWYCEESRKRRQQTALKSSKRSRLRKRGSDWEISMAAVFFRTKFHFHIKRRRKKMAFFVVDDVYSHTALAKLNNVMHLVSLLVPTGGLEPLLPDSIGSKTSVELWMRQKEGLSNYFWFFLHVLFPKWTHEMNPENLDNVPLGVYG